MQLSELLKQCPGDIKTRLHEVTFSAGDLILSQGDSPNYVYILLSGKAKVYHLALNGITFLHYIYRDIELFGEVEVLNQRPIISYVEAETNCKLKRMDEELFNNWLQSDPAFNTYVQLQLANKLYEASVNSVANIVFPLKYRVLYYLYQQKMKGLVHVSKEELLIGVGGKLRSLNRILIELMDEEVIDYDKGLIRILSVTEVFDQMKIYE
ncbi:MAG: cyclic nucleotide-binding domain-containing protein [Anaerolineaceae bacterium]|nr:cyclic nucleotide-binding domain-containing protein [Anaerolineaceae bacterium]